MNDIEARVQRGVEWLDRERPGWLNLIDLDSLNMASETSCIIGQAYSGYGDCCGWCYATGAIADFDNVEVSFTWWPDCAFSFDEECAALEEAWKSKIKELRSQ